ncbi:MAG TPA: hypothetical protein VL588_07905 [Bdellovibrionota bacterium]|nr:hypothetical protein [Bdellovibrionota bacterium]
MHYSAPILAAALVLAPAAWADAPTTPDGLVGDLTAKLTDQVLSQPGAQALLMPPQSQNAGDSGSAQGPMIEVGSADTASAPPTASAHGHGFGIDGQISFPFGVGVMATYRVFAPLQFGVGVSTTGATVGITADATLRVLPLFMDARWTPTVSVEFTHVRFTGLADDAITEFAPYLAQQGVQVSLAGGWLNAVTVMGGVEYSGPKGFHFTAQFGRVFQVGDSGGMSGEGGGVVLRGWQSWVGVIGLGYEF